MSDTSLISVFSFIGVGVVGYWCVIGFAMSMRWGLSGITWIYRNRDKINNFVKRDIKRVIKETEEHNYDDPRDKITMLSR